MMNKLRKKMRQRGVAMIEYAILLSFVAVIAVSFIGSNGPAKPINNIVTKITKILKSETAPGITHAGTQDKMAEIWKEFRDSAIIGTLANANGNGYVCGYLALSNGNQTQKNNCDEFLRLMGANDITDITGNDVNPAVWSVNSKGSGFNINQTDSINWKDSADSKYFMSYDSGSKTFAVYHGNMDKTTYAVVKGVNYEEAVDIYNAKAHPNGK